MFSFTPTDFKPAYQTILYAIEEQVQKFEMTGYKADGATEPEIALEKYMIFKRGAWCMKEDYYSTDEGCDMFFGMLMQLGGDHLMPKRSYDLRDESEAAKKKAEDGGNENLGPTFRSDRRLVRLVIFRYFANIAWRKFQRFQALKKQQKIKRAFLSQKTWNVESARTNAARQRACKSPRCSRTNVIVPRQYLKRRVNGIFTLNIVRCLTFLIFVSCHLSLMDSFRLLLAPRFFVRFFFLVFFFFFFGRPRIVGCCLIISSSRSV